MYKLLNYNINEWEYYNTIFKDMSLKEKTNNDLITNNLACIIVCVNYSDILKFTIEENLSIIKNIIIVTDSNDIQTHELCKKHDIKYLVTNVFYQNEKPCLNSYSELFKFQWWYKLYQYYKTFFTKKKVFNKAKAINYAIKTVKNKDWILLLDADIIISNQFSKVFKKDLDKDCLYGTHRFVYKTKKDWVNKENAILDRWKFMGFFQLFNKTSKYFTKNYYGYDEQFNYANSSDYFFMKKWIKKKLLNFPVIHLGETEVNWNGRVSELWI